MRRTPIRSSSFPLLRKFLFCAAAAVAASLFPASAFSDAGIAVESPLQVDALTAATNEPGQAERIPASALPITVAIVDYIKPSPNEPVLRATIDALQAAFGPDNIRIVHASLLNLQQLVQERKVDVFLASASFYLRVQHLGATPLANVASRAYPNSNSNDASAFIVSASRKDLNSLADLRGKRLVTSTPLAYTGLTIPQGELLRQGFQPDDFFSSTLFLGDGSAMVNALRLIREGEADVGFFRICFLEDWIQRHPGDASTFKVINRLDGSARPEPCMRSTELYPSWTMASTPATDPRVTRYIIRILFQIPPQGPDGLYWSVATDFSKIDNLYHELKIGPYAHLQEWTWRRFFDEYGVELGFILLFVLGLIFHSFRSQQLVEKRTAALQEAMRTQEKLRAEAEEANSRLAALSKSRAVSQLSSIFAHEVRQPLATISLYVFGLEKKISRGTVNLTAFANIIRKIADQTKRINEIVERVRAYGKSEEPHPKVLNLNDAAARAIDDLRKVGFPIKAVSFSPCNVPAPIYADPLDVELVALNLIKNALEAVKPLGDAGRVRVTVSEAPQDAKIPAGVILTVEDNGQPLSDEDFSRLSNMQPSKKTEGLGFGLAIVRGILERARGHLYFTRLPSGGLRAEARFLSFREVKAAFVSEEKAL